MPAEQRTIRPPRRLRRNAATPSSLPAAAAFPSSSSRRGRLAWAFAAAAVVLATILPLLSPSSSFSTVAASSVPAAAAAAADAVADAALLDIDAALSDTEKEVLHDTFKAYGGTAVSAKQEDVAEKERKATAEQTRKDSIAADKANKATYNQNYRDEVANAQADFKSNLDHMGVKTRPTDRAEQETWVKSGKPEYRDKANTGIPNTDPLQKVAGTLVASGPTMSEADYNELRSGGGLTSAKLGLGGGVTLQSVSMLPPVEKDPTKATAGKKQGNIIGVYEYNDAKGNKQEVAVNMHCDLTRRGLDIAFLSISDPAARARLFRRAAAGSAACKKAHANKVAGNVKNLFANQVRNKDGSLNIKASLSNMKKSKDPSVRASVGSVKKSDLKTGKAAKQPKGQAKKSLSNKNGKGSKRAAQSKSKKASSLGKGKTRGVGKSKGVGKAKLGGRKSAALAKKGKGKVAGKKGATRGVAKGKGKAAKGKAAGKKGPTRGVAKGKGKATKGRAGKGKAAKGKAVKAPKGKTARKANVPPKGGKAAKRQAGRNGAAKKGAGKPAARKSTGKPGAKKAAGKPAARKAAAKPAPRKAAARAPAAKSGKRK